MAHRRHNQTSLSLRSIRPWAISASGIPVGMHFSWLVGNALTVVVLAFLFGGGTLQGLWSDAIVQLASLPLIAVALKELSSRALTAQVWWALGLTAAVLALPIIQLIPLPPSIWSDLPGRTPFVVAYREAGVALPWLPISLDPSATWRSLLSLLPAISVFLACLSLGARIRRIISLVALGFIAISVFVGLAQLAGGPNSPLRFYEPTNVTDSVGFFANRNHYAALLYSGIPLATAWGFALLLKARRSPVRLTLVSLTYVFILLGLGMAHSRAGVILASVAALASIAVALGATHKVFGRATLKKAFIAVISVNAVGLLLAFQFGFIAIANRFDNDSLLADLRWPIAEVTWRATEATLPIGVGFGAFQPVYQMFETPAVVVEPYVNHAHDDWLELVLDAGVPAAVAVLVFLIWYAFATVRVWRSPVGDDHLIDGMLPRAGSIIVGLFLIHSTVDYPLRTTTLMVVLAFSCALLIPPLESPMTAVHGQPQEAKGSHRRTRKTFVSPRALN